MPSRSTVDHARRARFLLQEQLGVTGDAGAEIGRQGDGLVERVRVQRLGMALGGGHGLDAGTHDVVVDVLGGQRPTGGLRVGAQAHRLRVLRPELMHQLGPQHARGTQLGNLHEEVHADAPEEGQTRRELVDIEAHRLAGADVVNTVGQGIGHLDVGRGAGFLHVVAGNGNRIPLRHIGTRVGEDLRDDSHTRLRRVDVGVTNHELLEDVVLDRPGELLGLDALLLGGHHIEGQDRQHGAVHGHGHAHLVQRNAGEQLAHVIDGVDGHTGHADVTGDAGIVRVVATVGGRSKATDRPFWPAARLRR